jgi:VanZ family protein
MTALPRATRALAPLAWTALIAWFSSAAWEATTTRSAFLPWIQALLPLASPETWEALHLLIRKGAHLTEYGVLAALWAWTTGRWRSPVALAVLTAFLDEAHQATTLEREGSVADLLLDASGAAAALWVRERGLRAALDDLARGLLWITLLAINALAGAPSRWLWLSVPASWIALGLRRLRLRRR